jgi:hypothetical protein
VVLVGVVATVVVVVVTIGTSVVSGSELAVQKNL